MTYYTRHEETRPNRHSEKRPRRAPVTIAPLPSPGSLPPMTVEQLAGIMHAGVGTLGDVAYVPDECMTCRRARDWHEHVYAETHADRVEAAFKKEFPKAEEQFGAMPTARELGIDRLSKEKHD